MIEKVLLHIEETLELNMSLEEFENWQNNNFSKRRFIFQSLFFNRIKKAQPFFGELEEETLILKSTNSFLSYPRSQLNFTSLESDKKVVLKTEIQNGWLVIVFDVFLLVMIVTSIAAINWSRSMLSGEEFNVISQPFLILMATLLVMFSVQLYYLSYCIKKVHRLIKESLMIE